MNPVLKRVLTGLAIGGAVIATVLLAPHWVIMGIVSFLIVLAFAEYLCLLRLKLGDRLNAASWLWLWFLGMVVIWAGLWALPEIARRHGNVLLLFVVAIVKFSDVGGFAFGLTSAKLMKGGNHKMCPTVSPNKSWEGMFGSVLFSCVVALSFTGVTHFAWWQSLACGVTGAVVGTAGDLVESKFKRWVGVKDSSTMKITNGLGGVLDMLDSLLFAPAALMALIGRFS